MSTDKETLSTCSEPKVTDVAVSFSDDGHKPLAGMYETWFLDYASYVILERAVPHLADGLKPVQRRIMHTMKRSDDGRYSKVAGIVGDTMHYHPHGDSSIYGALVQLGQKDLLVETQGNWGNILTGDGAAAGRYIEARLSKLALDILFNPKTTEWKLSYDGRNKEPVALPAKFPLLLAQGAEGIAVGLSSKILPHNFGEICDAAIAHLKGKKFTLYPDFPTGGSIDVSNYNDGLRGGSVKVRAKIGKIDSRTLVITEIPYSTTTGSLIDSIVRANEKGKIKIKKIDDNTAKDVEIIVQLAPGVSSDQTIDALYAFTDCEVSISPNCAVIHSDKPEFMTVSDVLRHNVTLTEDLLRRELEIRRDELLESLFFATLERIFIEERMYKSKSFEEATDSKAVLSYLDIAFAPFKSNFVREVQSDDYMRLLEIKMARITKYNAEKAGELIARMESEVERIKSDLGRMTEVTINWYRMIRDKYGADHPRLTEIRSFETIVATKVAVANEKLYINREEGFIGTNLKKDEFVDHCSDIDDVIIFYRDGTYKIMRVADKVFVGQTERSKSEKKKSAEIIHIAIFKKNDKRTVYNVVYRDGMSSQYYIKRFNVKSFTYDREYDITQGKKGSKVVYFTANANGEAEEIKVLLKPNVKLRKQSFDKDFSELSVRNPKAKGNILTKCDVQKISLKAKGGSTLGGRKVWFDYDVNRINFDERGVYLGEFFTGDLILVLLKTGEYYTTNFDPNNHYEGDIHHVEKFDENKIWTAVLFDADNSKNLYVKRFSLEACKRNDRMLNVLSDNLSSKLCFMTDDYYARFQVNFKNGAVKREPLIIEAEEYVGIKGYKAHGKRVTNLSVASVVQLEPTRFVEQTTNIEEAEEDTTDAEPINDASPSDNNQPTLLDMMVEE